MAKRFSGHATISITYHDGDRTSGGQPFYKYTISSRGKSVASGRVRPPASGFGRGIAYDSAAAYDQSARAALNFALDDGHVDESELDGGPDGLLVTRKQHGYARAAKMTRMRSPR